MIQPDVRMDDVVVCAVNNELKAVLVVVDVAEHVVVVRSNGECRLVRLSSSGEDRMMNTSVDGEYFYDPRGPLKVVYLVVDAWEKEASKTSG
jgi:hypothetical protein